VPGSARIIALLRVLPPAFFVLYTSFDVGAVNIRRIGERSAFHNNAPQNVDIARGQTV
jgi:hypothetical protein